MKIKRIEHVGVVVRDTEASRKLWEGCFGIPLGSAEENSVRKLALYPIGESMIELIAGVKPDGKHARLVAEGKGGLNHICFEVENIDEALAELKSKGIPLLDPVPRIGHAGCRIAFLDPSATENCLIELAEAPRGTLGPGRIPMLFPVSLVGSYPQPEWLIDRAALANQSVPRVRMRELWRIPEPLLEEAQRDATLLAIREQEDAGLDVITDGEMRRESYSNRFATALDGIDLDQPGTMLNRRGKPQSVPRIAGPIRRSRPVELEDLRFLRAHTRRLAKITVPGPFTMTQLAQNDYYPDEESTALAFAAVVNEEVKDLFAAGADLVQIDEPYLQAQPDKARRYGLTALNRALEGVSGTTIVHLCFGYAAMVGQVKPEGYSFLPELYDCSCRQVSIETAQPALDCSVLERLGNKQIVLGVIDLGNMEIETPATVAERIRRALPYVAAERIVVAPDCGMKYLPRDVARGKMRAMVEGARIMRAEFGQR